MHAINILLPCLLLAPLPSLPAIPDISGMTTWGTIRQQGYKFTIEHSIWPGTGEIKRDGTVYVLWQDHDNGRLMQSVYRIVGMDLVGGYGWVDETTIEPDGSLTGNVHLHTILSRRGP